MAHMCRRACIHIYRRRSTPAQYYKTDKNYCQLIINSCVRGAPDMLLERRLIATVIKHI